ncbi:meiosis inhibitor protein 1 [Denticeps clupeoides]|uniref:meiosis inhibitor protein 1 n=1 Tax=Denticeps clupeoides TaxID=299321 RepID=UPI0010A4D779|nr:meiosis inhibitor protein 1 [Denticeps clupeoides]
MSGVDVVYEKIHFRHDPRWTASVGSGAEARVLCVACFTEMLETKEVSTVRKSAALSGVGGMLRRCPGFLRGLLLQEHGVCLHLTACILGMLYTEEDPTTLEKAVQVLVQLLLELQREQFVQNILTNIHKQLCEQGSVKGFMPTFTFLGKLVDAVPAVLQFLASNYVGLLEWLTAGLLYPDEELKASVCYVLKRLWCAVVVPLALRDKMALSLLQTLANACTPHLTINSLGLLHQMLNVGEVVAVLMSSELQEALVNYDIMSPMESPQYTELCGEHCSLPLILKKLLLSRDEALQVGSARCIAAVLVHSPSQYCGPFIKADIPEFLFERLGSSNREALLWSIYGCLMLLTEEPLFFSQCHSVYGIEPLVRSLRDVLKLSNLEVQKQGLQLLTLILDRHPGAVRLFPSRRGFIDVTEVVIGGVTSSCLQVAKQAVQAATALLRLNHQSSPVQYNELKKIVESVIIRCTELPLPIFSSHRSSVNMQASKTGGFLLLALQCFQQACSLAEQCASDPVLKQNAFTAPHKHSEDMVEYFCMSLLRCCDNACIPTVTKLCERVPSAQILQPFFSILSNQFTLLPSFMPEFAFKLASSGFIRLTLEYKGLLCAGNRNPGLNAACCGFLLRLCATLLSQPSNSHHEDVEDMLGVLEMSLPSLCVHVTEWPSIMLEAPVPHPHLQHCQVCLLSIALQYGDRFLSDSVLFACMVRVLCSVREQGDPYPPACVLRSALYLLSITQDRSSELDWGPLNSISKVLSSQPFSTLYTHHPSLLSFVFHYPALSEQFGQPLMELWLSRQPQSSPEDPSEPASSYSSSSTSPPSPLLPLLQKNSSVILTLLAMMCGSDTVLAAHALTELRGFVKAGCLSDPDVSSILRPALLQVFQKLGCEMANSPGGKVPASLSLVFQLLCLMQTGVSTEQEMDGTDFKLLYHVSNLAGKVRANCIEALLPAINYLYCCLALCPPHCTDRAVSMLLCNSGLMDQVQAVVDHSSSSSLSMSSMSPLSALLCCCHLFLSSLITLQHQHKAQVQKRIHLDLGRMVQLLSCSKRKMDSLSLACILRLLQSLLDVDLGSPVLWLEEGMALGCERPLKPSDSALYPLGIRGTLTLTTALHSLLLQKQEMLLCVSANCLKSLMGFLQRRCPTIGQHVVSQPWSRFLLYSLLSSGDRLLLHPATVSLLTVLMQFGSSSVLWDPDLAKVFSAVERRGVKELEQSTAQALRELLTQLECSVAVPPPSEQLRLRAQTLLESLNHCPTSPVQSNTILRLGELSVCSSHFSLTTGPLGK